MRHKKLVRELLEPVMAENGYKSKDIEVSGFFEKENAFSGQMQRIYLDIMQDYVTFRMELLPTTKYHYIKASEVFPHNESLFWMGDSGWIYETDMELRKILEYIASSMKDYGFRYLSAAAEDQDDLYATPEEDMDLYLFHEEYAEKFFRYHQLSNEDITSSLKTIKEELENLPQKPSQIDRKRIIQIAAAYGQIYIVKGGKWVMKNNRACIELVKAGSKWEQNVGSPLAWIFTCVSCDQREKVDYMVLKNLKDFGRL